MAKLLTDDLTYVSFPITKFEEDADGNLVVEGVVTDGTVDSDRQRVLPEFSAKALADWMDSGPNVRVMHSSSLYPAGRGLKVELGENAHRLRALVVEETAKKLVRNKVLRAYSVGIANPVIAHDPTGQAPGGLITGGTLAEVSLVDRPANKNCQLVLAKSADNDVPWTYGDLEALLAKAERDSDDHSTVIDPSDPGDPDDDSAPGSSADEDDRPDTDNSDDPDDDDAVKAYTAAVVLHKAAQPQRGDVPLNGTAYLQKAAEWQKWAALGDDEGLDGTPVGFDRWLAKRDFDPNVGGGVDRDKMPAADFVDQEGRRFPIHSPGDVSDAVSSYGRADPKIPFKSFKRRLMAIANRKGPEYVAALPASWTGKLADVTKDITLTSPDPAGLVPYNLQGAEENVATADLAKGNKNCKGCGKNYDADSKIRNCEACGKKLPKPKGYMTVAVEKSRAEGRDLPPDVAEAGEHREPDGADVEALEHDAGLPTDPDDEVLKGRKKGKKPAFPGAAKPFGKDKADDEPDEDDAMATKSYTAQRMHDALCAAYDWSQVVDAYPALKSAGLAGALDPAWFQTAAAAALGKGDMPAVGELAACHQSADTIVKGLVEPALLADAHAQVHKSFSDMYPTEHIAPGHGNVTPGQFQRPYISAGHAPLNASHGVTPEIPPSSHTINPGQFDRPLITAGHEAASPGDQAGNNPTGSVATGSSRQLYAAATKAAAESAMKAMHDRLVAAGPDMCPMAPSRHVLPPDNGARAVPTAVRPPQTHAAPGEKSAQVTYTAVPSTQVDTTYVAQPAGPDVEAIVAAAVREVQKAAKRAVRTAAETNQAEVQDLVLKAVDAQLTKTVATYDVRIAELEAEIDALGAQPDPAQAPLRGAVRTAPAPVVKAAEGDEQPKPDPDYVAWLDVMAKSANPLYRDMAEERRALLTKSD